MTVFKEV